ncbi:alpha/beta fold hydrolase [Photobacterium aquae]|uniref:alpha/beta fold hydrolase n=1 Tax=Photobacterium aquae TaxID=1195763 RepID=UPI00069E5F08|nr:alpha/beta fold hydrolase [Photobacterium aquae]
MRQAYRRTLARLSCAALLLGGTWVSFQVLARSDQPNDLTYERNCHLEGIREKVHCNTLPVAENRSDPTSRKIELSYSVLPAHKQKFPDEAFVIIAGGPGQAVSDYAGVFDKVFYAIRQSRDIILLDQRGTGRSNPLNCESGEEMSDLSFDDRAIDYSALAKACREEIKADVSQYGSLHAVADLDALRQHLGYRKLHLYGVSYGTRVAQLYLKKYPDHVATVSLDAVMPLEKSLLNSDGNVARSVSGLLAQCAADPDCHRFFPDLDNKLKSISRSLADQVVDIETMHPISGEIGTVRLTETKWESLIRAGLYADSSRAMLPFVIDRAAKQQFSAIVGLLSSWNQNLTMSMGMHASVVCAEDWGRATDTVRQQMAHDNDYGARQSLALYQAFCREWQIPLVEPVEFEQFESKVPVLMLSGGYDPVTPPEWAKPLETDFSNSLHLVSPYSSHGLALQTCANGIIADFVDKQQLDELDTDCIDNRQPRKFWLSPNSAEPRFTQEKKRNKEDAS